MIGGKQNPSIFRDVFITVYYDFSEIDLVVISQQVFNGKIKDVFHKKDSEVKFSTRVNLPIFFKIWLFLISLQVQK